MTFRAAGLDDIRESCVTEQPIPTETDTRANALCKGREGESI